MRIALALMLALLVAVPARAQDTLDAVDMATRIVEATRSKDVEPFIDSIWPIQEQQLRRAYPQIDQEVLDKIKLAFLTTLQEAMAAANQRAIALYAETMTEAELRETLAFTESETGRKYLVTGQTILEQSGAPFIQSVIHRFAGAASEILAAAQLGPPRVSN